METAKTETVTKRHEKSYVRNETGLTFIRKSVWRPSLHELSGGTRWRRRRSVSRQRTNTLKMGREQEGREGLMGLKDASGTQPGGDGALRGPDAGQLTASRAGGQGFGPGRGRRATKKSHDIHKKGIDDTDKHSYRSLPQCEARGGPHVSLLSNLFIDQCLHVINSWLVN